MDKALPGITSQVESTKSLGSGKGVFRRGSERAFFAPNGNGLWQSVELLIDIYFFVMREGGVPFITGAKL